MLEVHDSMTSTYRVQLEAFLYICPNQGGKVVNTFALPITPISKLDLIARINGLIEH